MKTEKMKIVSLTMLAVLVLGAGLALMNYYQHVPVLTISSPELAKNLQPASKVVNGAVAYWRKDDKGNDCFFGIHTPYRWSALTLPSPCPSGPDDDVSISNLIKKLWDSWVEKGNISWEKHLLAGGDEAAHVNAIVELGRAYGITLTP